MILGAILASSTLAQNVETDKYKLTHEQELEMKVRQKDAQLAQVALSQAQQNYQVKIADLSSECEEIKKANHWNTKTFCDLNTLTFCDEATVGPSGPQCPTAQVPLPPKKEEKK
jgi:hypothetical protein